ncbi:MAG: type II secretion system F family protein [Coriobacteriales bacterium]|jgi:type IV pilus assembly protein PilC|nr:type II secretion system F family protein [Coriobacteriales bacterium]
MPEYTYNAVAMDGTKKRGRLAAPDVPQLAALLSEAGLFLVDQRVIDDKSKQKKLKTVEVADFCRQLAAMLSSGITLIRAMMIIAERDAKPHVKRVYEAVIDELRRGLPLSEAMAAQGKAFPELLISMIHAGENSGGMDTVASKMAETYDKQHKLDSKIQSASIYPIILVVMIIAVIIVLFTFVIPQFQTMFESMVLPLPTQIMMSISHFLVNYWFLVILGIVLIVAVFAAALQQPGPKRRADKLVLKMPKVGKLMQIVVTARFARTLSSLYVSGIPMIQALNIVRNTVGNSYIESQFDDVITALGNGGTLSQSLSIVDGFDRKLISTIRIGEESGRLESMLESIADQYDYDSEMATQRLVALMEPTMIIVMAAVVAVVIISVLLPMFSMYESIGA